MLQPDHTKDETIKYYKTGVVSFPRDRGHCIPLWTVLPPLQVVLSYACSVASLGRCPSHYLPGHPHLRRDALADCLFGKGSPTTWRAGHKPLHDTPSVKPSFRAQKSMTLPRWHAQGMQAHLPQQRTNANGARQQVSQKRKPAACWEDSAQLHPARTPRHTKTSVSIPH